MKIELTSDQEKAFSFFREFTEKFILPYADDFDRNRETPEDLLSEMGSAGLLGSFIPAEYQGRGDDMLTAGLLFEQVGRASGSILSLLAVHGMVSLAILKWGTDEQKNRWLPKLAKGEVIAAFGLSEPRIGSDAKNVETKAVPKNGRYLLSGKKKWISFGQRADLFIVFTRVDDQPTAFLVEKDYDGFSREPIDGMLGFRAAMLAALELNQCRVPEENMIGKVGSGFSLVAGTALDYGRYCIACGCVGLAQACLEASVKYARERKQGESYLKDYQLIRGMIADMVVNVKAARLLCRNAGYLKDTKDPDSIMETAAAKYFASKAAAKIADDAVQIHGANGVCNEFSVQRFYRDAKIMEIIEGSNQIQQLIISNYAYQIF